MAEGTRSSAAERQRAYRERRAAGFRVFRIVLDEAAVEQCLLNLGRLHPNGADDPATVDEAFQDLSADMVARLLARRDT